jgi:hypothetical protein
VGTIPPPARFCRIEPPPPLPSSLLTLARQGGGIRGMGVLEPDRRALRLHDGSQGRRRCEGRPVASQRRRQGRGCRIAGVTPVPGLRCGLGWGRLTTTLGQGPPKHIVQLFIRSVAQCCRSVYWFWVPAKPARTWYLVRSTSTRSRYEVRGTEYAVRAKRGTVHSHNSIPRPKTAGALGLKGNPPPAQVGPLKGPIRLRRGPPF